MAKKKFPNKYAGMKDIFQDEIDRKTAEFEAAIHKLDAEIHGIKEEIKAIEQSSTKYDSGLEEIENRNEIRYLEDRLEDLESDRDALRHQQEEYYKKMLNLEKNR